MITWIDVNIGGVHQQQNSNCSPWIANAAAKNW